MKKKKKTYKYGNNKQFYITMSCFESKNNIINMNLN